MQSKVLSTSSDVYGTITDKIVAAIEAGASNFVMPWHRVSPDVGRPTNAQSGARYQGINVLALWVASVTGSFGSGWWATYRQWEELGAQVRRGEHGTVIVFFKQITVPDAEEPADEVRQRFVARAFRVFNHEQVEGWQPPGLSAEVSAPIDRAEIFIAHTGALVRHGASGAWYSPSDDLIRLPDRNLFKAAEGRSSTEAYYSTLLHELTHWSGAKHRLDREFGGRFGDEAYAMEELVAELGAAFLCADLGISSEPRSDHASYLASWLRVLKADTRAIFTAATRANEAASFLGECASKNSAA